MMILMRTMMKTNSYLKRKVRQSKKILLAQPDRAMRSHSKLMTTRMVKRIRSNWKGKLLTMWCQLLQPIGRRRIALRT
jgi:hypothetical protein